MVEFITRFLQTDQGTWIQVWCKGSSGGVLTVTQIQIWCGHVLDVKFHSMEGSTTFEGTNDEFVAEFVRIISSRTRVTGDEQTLVMEWTTSMEETDKHVFGFQHGPHFYRGRSLTL